MSNHPSSKARKKYLAKLKRLGLQLGLKKINWHQYNKEVASAEFRYLNEGDEWASRIA